MDMEHLWNATDRAKLKYSERNRIKRHFADQQYHTDWPGIEPIFGGREADDKRPETRHSHEFDYTCQSRLRNSLPCTKQIRNKRNT